MIDDLIESLSLSVRQPFPNDRLKSSVCLK